jgi:hypothetical protein
MHAGNVSDHASDRVVTVILQREYIFNTKESWHDDNVTGDLCDGREL